MVRYWHWILVFITAVVLTLVLVPRPAAVIPSKSASSVLAAGDTNLYLTDLDQTSYAWSAIAPKYSAIELNSWNTTALNAIHATSPSTKVLEYKDLSSTRENDCGTNPGGGSPCVVNNVICPSGVNDAPFYAGGLGFCNTWRSHPEWFLTRNGSTANSSTPIGNLYNESGFTTQYEMDYGNPGYQSAWLAAVKADLAARGWAGIRADNALVTASAYGRPSPKYPTDASVQAATLAMLKVVGPGLTSSGLQIIPNVGYNNLYPSVWANWLTLVSGLEDEYSWYWPGQGSQGNSSSAWGPWMEPEIQACASQSKTCLFHAGGHGDVMTAQHSAFAVGSYLLYADGNSYVENGGDTPSADAAIRYSLGAAIGPAPNTGGIYTRVFANGKVVVDSVNGTAVITVGSSCLA